MIKVLVVDDSLLVRKALARALSTDSDIEVVGTAVDPYDAREKIKLLNPDVLTLDVSMPRMDGITFLKNLMRLRPMPVVMVSSYTADGAQETLDALELGAFDYVTKPSGSRVDIDQYKAEVLQKVKAAARANMSSLSRTRTQAEEGINSAVGGLSMRDPLERAKVKSKMIAIGASTGGTEALKDVMRLMPAECPPIVISQHIPESFSAPFAKRLNESSAVTVKQAEDGDLILPGHAYLAPGDDHLLIVREGANMRCRLSKSPPVNRHRPSVDVMFDSVVQAIGKNAVGVLLTGMGNDGAKGLLNLKDVGAMTIAQDEKSSVVWGMPGEAVKLGAAQKIEPLTRIPDRIMEAVRKGCGV